MTKPSTAIATHDETNVARMPSQEASLLGIIERVASNPDVDMERMQALLNMRADEEERQRRIAREDRDEQARREWLTAFSVVQSEIEPIARGKKNDHTKSKYADLADIERMVSPILTKNGFSTTVTPLPCDLQGHIRVRLTIGHTGGHERHYEDNFPLDGAGAKGGTNKTDIQAKGSSQTYGRRYLKASALDLAFTDDNDGNAQPPAPGGEPEYISENALDGIRRELAELGADEAGFCEYLKVDRLALLPVERFGDACTALVSKRNILAKKKAAEAEAATAQSSKSEAAP